MIKEDFSHKFPARVCEQSISKYCPIQPKAKPQKLSKNIAPVPKGSYHTFCRKLYGLDNQGSHHQSVNPNNYRRAIQTAHHSNNQHTSRAIGHENSKSQPRQRKAIEIFDTFEEYIKKLKEDENQKIGQLKSGEQKAQHTNIHLKRTSKTGNRKREKQVRGGKTVLQQKNFNEFQDLRECQQLAKIDIEKRKNQRLSSRKTKKHSKQKVESILPFFRIKLDLYEKGNVENKQCRSQTQFKMDSRKFRLKSLLIEQNKVIEKWSPQLL